MADLFKFRCPACGKLLGAPPRKVGRPIHCPRCGAEQVVPRPADDPAGEDEDDDESADDEAEDAVDLGIDLGLGATPALGPTEAPAGPRPLEGLDIKTLIDEYLKQGQAVPAPPARSDDEEDEDEAEPLVDPRPGPLVPAPGHRGRRHRAAGPRPGRDVVLPRTAVVAWSLFALLALGLSFLAGLMVGHYRWR